MLHARAETLAIIALTLAQGVLIKDQPPFTRLLDKPQTQIIVHCIGRTCGVLIIIVNRQEGNAHLFGFHDAQQTKGDLPVWIGKPALRKVDEVADSGNMFAIGQDAMERCPLGEGR